MLRSFLILLLCLMAQAEPKAKANDFWKLDSERSADITVTTFSAKKAPAKGQGILMCAAWPNQEGEPVLEPSEVVSSMYGDLKDFQLLGSKEAVWGEQAAHLISFKAMVNKRPVVGRSLMAQTASGTEVVLLVTNHEAQKDFRKEFERLQSSWQFGQPASRNVLGTP